MRIQSSRLDLLATKNGIWPQSAPCHSHTPWHHHLGLHHIIKNSTMQRKTHTLLRKLTILLAMSALFKVHRPNSSIPEYDSLAKTSPQSNPTSTSNHFHLHHDREDINVSGNLHIMDQPNVPQNSPSKKQRFEDKCVWRLTPGNTKTQKKNYLRLY